MFLVVNITDREIMTGMKRQRETNSDKLGKLNRGISVVDTVRILKGDAVTEDDIFKATVLGWMIEFVSFCLFLSDQIREKKSNLKPKNTLFL